MNIITHFWIAHIMSNDSRVFLNLPQKTLRELGLIVHHELGHFSALVNNNGLRLEHVWLFLVLKAHKISLNLIFLFFFLFHFFYFHNVQKLLLFLNFELLFFLLSFNGLNFQLLISFVLKHLFTFCSLKNIFYISRQFFSFLLLYFHNQSPILVR